MQSEDLALVRKAWRKYLDERQQFVLKQDFGFDAPSHPESYWRSNRTDPSSESARSNNNAWPVFA